MKLYRVRDWDKHFEKAQNRKLINAVWVPLPTKHDGKSFRRLISAPDGLAHYGAWVLIVQVAAKCTPRGTLTDEQGPLTAEDLAIKTGAPEALIQEALTALSSERVGWLEALDYPSKPAPLEPGSSDTPATVERHSSDTPASLESPQDKQTGQIQTVERHSSDSRASLEPHDTTTQDKTEQDKTGHNNGALGASPACASGAGVCVRPEIPPGITREQLLAYAADPVAGQGITNPHGWATARLKDHAADGLVGEWLLRKQNGDPRIAPLPAKVRRSHQSIEDWKERRKVNQ